MNDLPLENGTIRFARDRATDEITATWEGGAVVRISPQLIDAGDPRYVERTGNDLTMCQFKLRILGKTTTGDYIAQRVDPPVVDA